VNEWSALEGSLRGTAFLGAIAVLALLQWRYALRGDSRLNRRQLVNVGLVVIDTAVVRLAFPVLAVGLAYFVHQQDGGLFGALALPSWLEAALAVLLLDLAIYWQHRLMHRIPVLWRLHRVHHSDTAFDLTTGVRFHPLEIALSMLIKLGLVAALGPHPGAVLAFELLLSLGSLWTHTDIALPGHVDRSLRRLIVTPSMHRIHHSPLRAETDSNYGFHLSIWDRLFGSYTESPRTAERDMTIGLDQFRDASQQTLVALLLNPFISPASGQFATNRKKSPPR